MSDNCDEHDQPSRQTGRTEFEARELAFIGAAIGRMPQRRREVFCAVRIDDASYHDVAAQLGLTVQEVEAELAAALRQIRHARGGRSPGIYLRRWIHRITYRPRQ